MQGVGVRIALGDNETASRTPADARSTPAISIEAPAFGSLHLACRTGVQFPPTVAAFIDWVTDRTGADSMNGARLQPLQPFAPAVRTSP